MKKSKIIYFLSIIFFCSALAVNAEECGEGKKKVWGDCVEGKSKKVNSNSNIKLKGMWKKIKDLGGENIGEPG